jgi:hypothetical protein
LVVLTVGAEREIPVPYGESNPGPATCSMVTAQTELPRLCFALLQNKTDRKRNDAALLVQTEVRALVLFRNSHSSVTVRVFKFCSCLKL